MYFYLVFSLSGLCFENGAHLFIYNLDGFPRGYLTTQKLTKQPRQECLSYYIYQWHSRTDLLVCLRYMSL